MLPLPHSGPGSGKGTKEARGQGTNILPVTKPICMGRGKLWGVKKAVEWDECI